MSSCGGRGGLRHDGNTCYLAAALQALFEADSYEGPPAQVFVMQACEFGRFLGCEA